MNDILEKYKNSREKINSELVNQLRNNTTDLSDNPAIPKKDAFGNPINFLEMVAYKRFLEVVERVKRNTGIQDISGQSGFMQLQGILSESAYKIFGVEATQINYLEKLAVDLVIEEMKIPNGAFQFDCKIVSLGKVSKQGFQDEAQNPSENEIEKTFGEQSSANDMTPNELFELEKHKRRFINLLIQGASKKGHYMYLLVQDKLNNINPELSSLYGKMMSINDLTYWILPDSMIKMIASNSSSMAGKEEIDDTTNPPTIKTQAICFPVSIHEIIKGIMEVFGTQGLPDEPNMAQMIIDSVDSLANETTDLRLGVGIWEIFYNCYPAFVFEDEYKHIQHYMFARFCALEIEEFFKVSRMILSDETRGKKYMLDLANEIVSDLKNREYNDTFDNDDDDMTFNNGGTADDMTMIGRAIEFLTGTAIERDSIVDKGFKYEFRYKGKSIVTSIDSKLVRDTIYSNKKSLAGRYENGGEAEFNDAGTSLAMYHEKQGNFIIPKGQIYLWLYDKEDGAKKLNSGEYDYVFYPFASMSMAWQKGFIPPLKRIWTKKFQKENKGAEHLLGVIKAFLIDKDGKQELYIDMMSVNPNKKKKGIMSYMIKDLRNSFNLSQDQITFSKLTPEGEKFVAKKTFEGGGGVDENNYRISISENDKYIGEYPNPIRSITEAKTIFVQLATKYKRPQYLISVSRMPTSTSGYEKINVDEWYRYAESFKDGGSINKGVRKFGIGGEIEYKVNGLTKQDFIDAYLKRERETIKKAKKNNQYDEDFDVLLAFDEDGGLTDVEEVGWWLNNEKGNIPLALTSIMAITDYISVGWDDYRKKDLEQLFFGKNIDVKFDLLTAGDYELGLVDELQKIKLLSKKVDFDEVRGTIDYEEAMDNTNLMFYKNGQLVMSLAGFWSENEELETIIEIDDEQIELNYHPFASLGGLDLNKLEMNINDAFSELGIYSAVVSIEGYEEYAEDVEGLENAKDLIQNIKANTRFQVLKGRSVGIGKRVDDSRVIDEFENGGGVEQYINMDKMNPYKYQVVKNFNTLKSLAKKGFIELDEKTGLRYKNYEDKMKSQVRGYVTNVRHDYIKSALSPHFEYNNKKYSIGYEKGLNFLKLYVLEDISN